MSPLPSRLRVVVALALVLLAVPAARSGMAASRSGPLTNEDVVRLVMTGTPEKEILASIASRPVDFDLSPETVQELRVAGVGERVVEAMRARQAAMPQGTPAPAPTAAPETVRTGTLRLDFEAGAAGDPPSSLSAIALKTLPKGTRRRGGEEVALMTDMALAILCTMADHVPDHWDARSPIQGAPRHELLLFRPGSATEKVKGHEVLYLDHPPFTELSLPEGTHNIVIAAVGKQAGSGTWRLLESDGARVDIRAGRTTRMTLRARSGIKGSAMTGFHVDSEWKIAGVETAPDGTAGAPDPARPEGRP